MHFQPLSETERQQEQQDLKLVQNINNQIDKLEADKQEVVQRVVARYTAGNGQVQSSDAGTRRKYTFDDLKQQHAYDFLLKEKESVMKPMAAFIRSRGVDLGTSDKPGSSVAPALRRRPNVFKYDPDTEKWSLVDAGEGA